MKTFLAAAILAIGVAPAYGQSEPYLLTHEAGAVGGPGLSNGVGWTARFSAPAGVATDGKGTVYVAEAASSTIRKVTAAGVVTLLAGRAGIPGLADGVGDSAAFNMPLGVAVDTAGTVWVVDTGNHTIRKVTASGVVTTLAGSGGQPGSVDGPGATARFSRPGAIALDKSSNLYVADTGNHTIRKVTPSGVVTTLAGSAGEIGSGDGTGSAARFWNPGGIAVDGAGNVWVADTDNHIIRRISAAGTVTTIAGVARLPGRVDGPGQAATFAWPVGLALDAAGFVYVSDARGHTLRRISPERAVVTLAGHAGEPGSDDGTGFEVGFNMPLGLAFDGASLLYVADSGNHTIRTATLDGVVTTLVGLAGQLGWGDGTGSDALFAAPMGLARDALGNLYVADSDNHVVRKITAQGLVSTLAGEPGVPGSSDGPASVAHFNQPVGLALDGAGNLFVSDAGNHTIRKISPNGTVTTFAGAAGQSGSANGTATAARFDHPWGLAVDGTGSLYVADAWNHTIRKITAAGVVSTLAGKAGESGSTNDTGGAARFAFPRGVAVDGSRNLLVADAGNAVIRKITSGGVVTTLAGKAGETGRAEGTGSSARFRALTAVALDATGTLFVADDRSLRRVSASGEVRNLVGNALVPGTDDGIGSRGLLGPGVGGLVVGPGGILYIADTANNCIRRATPGFALLPTISSITPKSGGMAGGTQVTIAGTNFTTTNLGIKLGGGYLTDVTVLGSTLITARVPAASFGPKDLEVTSAAGRGFLSQAFNYTRYLKYFAEGATLGDFSVELALLNPFATSAPTTLRFSKPDGATVTRSLTVAPRSRATVWPAQLQGLAKAEFSTTVESDLPLVADRTMTWGAAGHGSHAETAVSSPALAWFLAEGATHSSFDLFYLIQNPNPGDALVEVTFLLPAGRSPLVRTYSVRANSRFTIWVDAIPELASTDVSASLRSTNGVPIIVERAMYFSNQGRTFNAGHEGAGITTPTTRWFLAEGATGSFFDMFILIANPNAGDAEVRAEYLLPDGTTRTKDYRVAARSRFNIWVDYEEIPSGSGQYPLANVAVSTTLTSTNGMPIVVERAMWWPGDAGRWHEAHNSAGATETGTAWALAAGEVSTDARRVETFILIANTSSDWGKADVTLFFEDGTSVRRSYELPPNSRTNSWVNTDFPQAVNRRFGVLVESVVPAPGAQPAQIVVERAMYSSMPGQTWAAGTNAMGTRLK